MAREKPVVALLSPSGLAKQVFHYVEETLALLTQRGKAKQAFLFLSLPLVKEMKQLSSFANSFPFPLASLP